MIPAAADRDCILPLSSWAEPISARELQAAAKIISAFDPQGVQIVTRRVHRHEPGSSRTTSTSSGSSTSRRTASSLPALRSARRSRRC